MVGGGNIEGIERQSELDGVVEVYPFGSCVIRLVRRQRRESFPRPVCASVRPVGPVVE